MLQRRWQGRRRSPAQSLACRSGQRYRGIEYHIIAAMLLVFATVVRAARAEPPAEDLPRVDQCRTVYVCEPDTELLQTRDGAVCINREVQPGHDECWLRYAQREMPFPLFRLRSHARSELFLPPYLDLQGIDADGRPWFLGGEPTRDNKAGGIDVFWIDSGVLRRRQFKDGYSRLPAGQGFDTTWPWAGTDMLCDAEGTVWVVGWDRLYRLAADKLTEGKPDEIPFPTPADPQQANDLRGQNPYWGHQVYRFGGSTWVVRGIGTNCHVPGSFVLRFTGQRSTVVAWLPQQYVSGLVHHAGDAYILADRAYWPHEPHPRPKPTAIFRVPLAGPAPQAAEAGRRIAKLEGVSTARLVFIDRQGRQYVQPWSDDKPRAELLVFDGTTCAKAALPSADFSLDCQGDDGRLHGHDGQALYAGWTKHTGWRPTASLGALTGHDVRVLAAAKGLLCLGIKMRHCYSDCYLPVWLDLSSADTRPLLPGKSIAAGLAVESNESNYYHVAVGPGGRLWFLRYSRTAGRDVQDRQAEKTVRTQICRATGGAAGELTGKLATSVDPSVWPVAEDTAIVAASWGFEGVERVLFYDRGEAHAAPSLAKLLEAHYQRLQETMADGTAFTAGDDYEQAWFLRMGDTFYVEEALFKHVGNGSGMYRSSGIFRAGQWIEQREQGGFGDRQYEPVVNRLVDLDLPTHRLLGFVDGWKTLKWIPLASDACRGEVLRTDSDAWAFRCTNSTSLPRFTGAWTLTPDAAEHFRRVRPQRLEEARNHGYTPPEVYAAYSSDDMPAWRRWQGGKWRTIDRSFCGGTVWEDAAGGVWHFRVREAEVTFPDGRRQLVPLDAGTPERFRMAIESADAVWVASQQSLCRFCLQRDMQGRPVRWTAEPPFRLPRFGVDFAGPWIAGGGLYYISAGKLFHCPVHRPGGEQHQETAIPGTAP